MTAQTRPNYDRPLFNLHKVSSTPVIVENIDLVRWRDIYFLRARSRDGTEGLVMINDGRHFLTAMLKERILPFFVGRDARDLETLVDEIYVYKWNYKYAGSAFWTTVAWAEAALFDLLGKATGKPIADLLGGLRRNEVPVYVSSLIRETSTHFCATLPELPIEMEYAAALPKHPMDWYGPQIEVKDGLVAVPAGPGQ